MTETPLTLQQTLDLAAAEGITLGYRMGRLSARGDSSPELTNALHQNEAALVRHFGGVYHRGDPLDRGARRSAE